MLCHSFMRVPKRCHEPAYYEIVTNPIDLLRVQQKLKTKSYEDLNELTADIELLVNNAKAFYIPESEEYVDATILLEIFTQNKQKIIDGEFVRILKLAKTLTIEEQYQLREAVSKQPRTSHFSNPLLPPLHI